MKVMVTGAGGFVGRALLKRLVENDHEVVGLDNHADGIPDCTRKVIGDICALDVLTDAFGDGCDAIIHLATVPGGAAEADPAASRRVNIEAMYNLLEIAREAGSRPRIVFASSIAVLGNPLPETGVDDATPVAPQMVYGGHKAMMETAIAMMSNRGEIDGVSLRLPAVLARPKGPSGLKSAFMSELFHALRAHQEFVCPVSENATIWAVSISGCVTNLLHALTFESSLLPVTRAVTLPALQTRIADLVSSIARQCGTSPELVRYAPDTALEDAFGRYPVLKTTAAERAGFCHDGDLDSLVGAALSEIAASDFGHDGAHQD